MKKKKNIILGVLILILTFLVCGLIFIIGNKFNAKDYEGIKVLDMQTLREKINNKEYFPLIITQTTCPHCNSYLPKVEEVAKEYNITFYDIKMDKLNTEELKELRNIANVGSTPTTIFIKEGEEKTTTSRLLGDASKEKIINRLKSEGMINE